MRDYLIRRFLLLIPTLLGVSFVAFTITRFVPGGPLDMARAEAQQAAVKSGRQSGGSQDALSAEQMKILEKYYGFDQPLLIAYGQYLGVLRREIEVPPKEDAPPGTEAVTEKRFAGLLQFSFGQSFRHGEPVWKVIRSRFPVSIYFGLISLFATYLVCIPMGVAKAMRHRTGFDCTSSIIIFTGYAIPGYVLGILLLQVFAFKLGWLPHSGFRGENFDTLSLAGKIKDQLRHTIMPLTCYLLGHFAVLTMIMKNQLMDNLASDYVRTAMSKGISFKRAVWGHAFRNSLVPIATSFGHLVTMFVAGSLLIERIFDIQGFGLLGFSAVVDRDYPLMLGILILSSFLMLLGNIISDIAVAFVDPRIRFGK